MKGMPRRWKPLGRPDHPPPKPKKPQPQPWDVALPFPPDDPIYGGEGKGRESGSVSLGRLSPRGEKGALILSADVLMRVLWNPFFPYLGRRLDMWVGVVQP